uniref:Calcineurin-like phosphoesterase domain-containing protein n=1 Tax=Guillardia theta TaxID=55529 RepID=A0A7S4P3M0_GUITH|mmetsp:Transcript_42406/g.133587  ORF Transcript_42406/g.133587 Transcript_42406/m.133587 type:complete len:563 (+) Transcript_42406:485-2173(+)
MQLIARKRKKWNRCLANAVKRADDFQIKNKELHETIQDLQLRLSLKEDEYKEVVSEREVLRKSLRSLQREQMASNDQTNRVRRHSLSIVENMNLAKGLILDVGIFIQEDMKACIHELNDLVEDFKKEGVDTSMPLVKSMSNTSSEKESDLDISHEIQRTHQVCIYITDIKGDMQRFRRTIAASMYVNFMDKEQMELTIDEGAQLVYGGNAFHSESKSLEFVKCILSIKQRYPQQVHLLLGHDDLKLLKNQLVHSDERYFLLHDYLKFADVGYRFGETLFLNCKVTSKIAGIVPGHHVNSLGPHEWIKELNSWVNNEISEVFEQHKSVVSRGSIVERLSSFLYTEGSTHEMLRIPRSTQIYFVQGGITTLIGVSPVNIHFPWAPDQSLLCGIFAPNLHWGNSRFAIRLEWNGLPTLLGTTPDEKEFAFEIDVEGNSIGAGDYHGKQLPDGRCIFASERDREGQRRFLVTTIPSEEDLLRNQLPKTDTIEAELLNLLSDPRLAEERSAEWTDKNTLSEMQQDESNRLPEESTIIPSQEFQKQLKAKNDQIELLARQLEEIMLKL